MNCFIRRIAAEEEEKAAARKVAESRSEMGTDMIGNREGCQEIKQIIHCTFSLAMKTKMCHLVGQSTTYPNLKFYLLPCMAEEATVSAAADEVMVLSLSDPF